MLKNVIFDFGQVLVRFEPSYMVGQFVKDPEDKALLERVVFDRLYWDKLDAGTISDDEVIRACRARVPERLWESAEDIYRAWIYNIPEISGMRELLSTLKTSHGVGLYLLSNISTYFASHAHEIPILSYFDGCVFSAVCGCVKPSAEIFSHVCEKFGIEKESAIFIDDSEKNVKGAENFGLRAYLFDGDAKKLKAYLEGLLK